METDVRLLAFYSARWALSSSLPLTAPVAFAIELCRSSPEDVESIVSLINVD